MAIISISVLLATHLGDDVANVAVCSGNFYQGMLGCDMLYGHNKALGPNTIALSGPK